MFSSSLIILFLCVVEQGWSEIPSYIQVCKRNDPHIEDCIVSSVEKLKPQLVKGIPELDVPPLEPLHLPEVVISRGGNFRALGSDVIVRGASGFQITRLKADIDNLVYNFGIKIPFLSFDAIYDVDMKLLVIPIKGRGPISANTTNVEGDVELKGHKVKHEDGEAYVHFDSLSLKLNVGDYKVHLENLFNGDKALGDAVNVAINDNRAGLMRAVTPVVEKVAASLFLDIANKITKHFAYKELFPED